MWVDIKQTQCKVFDKIPGCTIFRSGYRISKSNVFKVDWYYNANKHLHGDKVQWKLSLSDSNPHFSLQLFLRHYNYSSWYHYERKGNHIKDIRLQSAICDSNRNSRVDLS